MATRPVHPKKNPAQIALSDRVDGIMRHARGLSGAGRNQYLRRQAEKLNDELADLALTGRAAATSNLAGLTVKDVSAAMNWLLAQVNTNLPVERAVETRPGDYRKGSDDILRQIRGL